MNGIDLSYMPCGLGELIQLQTLPLFLVRNESDRGEGKHKKRIGGVSELKFFNNLRGQLEIEGLLNAKASEAKEANLKGKQYLKSLGLHWSGSEESEEAAMKSLQPHPNLKELRVKYYEGVRFPNWMMNDGLNLLLPNPVTITLRDCKISQVLPPLGQLPSLKLLVLRDLDAVEYVKDYPLSAKPFFPSLKRLTIYNMLSSTSNGWGMRDVAVHQAPSYPYLEHPYLSNITAELCLHFICAFSSLKSLEISNLEDLISLSLGLQHLSTLQTLTINHSKNLASLPYSIGCLTSLTQLQIIFCPKLTSLPKEM